VIRVDDDTKRAILDRRAERLATRQVGQSVPRGTEMVVAGIGGDRFAIPVAAVISVVSLSDVLALPGAEPWNAGIVLYEDVPVCLVDVLPLLGRDPSPNRSLMIVVQTIRGWLAIAASELVGLRRFEDAELTTIEGKGSAAFVQHVSEDLVRSIDPDGLAADQRICAWAGQD